MRLFASGRRKDGRNPTALARWYLGYCQWSDELFASSALLTVRLILLLSSVLPLGRRAWPQACVRLLRNFAYTIRQPEYARMWMNWQVTGRALIDACLLSIPIWWMSNWYAYFLVTHRLSWLTLLLLLLYILLWCVSWIFYLISAIAFVSGDAYLDGQDEFQMSAANQAGMFTLRIVVCLLCLLSLAYLLVVPWRDWAFVHMALLLLVARVVYMSKIILLRWSDLTYEEAGEEAEQRKLKVVRNE